MPLSTLYYFSNDRYSNALVNSLSHSFLILIRKSFVLNMNRNSNTLATIIIEFALNMNNSTNAYVY